MLFFYRNEIGTVVSSECFLDDPGLLLYFVFFCGSSCEMIHDALGCILDQRVDS